MGRTALSLEASTFAFFTRNPRGGSVRALDEDDVAKLRRLMDENGFGKLVAHAPYTYNLCSAKERARTFALEAMAEDLRRMEVLPGMYYNFHPGAHVGQAHRLRTVPGDGARSDDAGAPRNHGGQGYRGGPHV